MSDFKPNKSDKIMTPKDLKINAVTITLMAIATVAWVLYGSKQCSIYPAVIMTTLQALWLYKIMKSK